MFALPPKSGRIANIGDRLKSARSDQAIGPNNASFDGLARLHDRKQRDHAAQWKIDALDRLPRLVQHDTRSKVHQAEPRLHALEFVSRKLPQNAVLYDVLGLHMPASVAPSVGQRPRHYSWFRTDGLDHTWWKREAWLTGQPERLDKTA